MQGIVETTGNDRRPNYAYMVAAQSKADYIGRKTAALGDLVASLMIVNKVYQWMSHNVMPGYKGLTLQQRRNVDAWRQAYHVIDINFQKHFDWDTQEMICDSMDHFDEYTRNCMVRCRIAYRNMLREVVPEKHLSEISSLVLCSELVEVARSLYDRVCDCPDINFQKMRNSIKNYAKCIFPLDKVVLVDDDKLRRVTEEEKEFGMTISRWIVDPQGPFLTKFCMPRSEFIKLYGEI